MNTTVKTSILLLLTIYIVSISAALCNNTEPIRWYTNIDSAKTAAKTENKIILMNFSGSDWCANCIRLDRTLFQTEEFAKFANENLILLKVDFPARKKNKLSPEQTKHNEKLAEKYNKKGAFPTVLFIDNEGNVLGQLKQPQNSVKEYIDNMKSIIIK